MGKAGSRTTACAVINPRGAARGVEAVQEVRIFYCLPWIRCVRVGAPLSDVALHVVQPPGVRRKAAHWRREEKSVVPGREAGGDLRMLFLQGNIRDIGMTLQADHALPAAVLPCRAGQTGVLPLRL